jgi:hypothetical protein
LTGVAWQCEKVNIVATALSRAFFLRWIWVDGAACYVREKVWLQESF